GVRSIITSERNGNVAGALCVKDTDGVMMVASSGQTVRISLKNTRVMGRNTQGVKLANLKDDAKLVAGQRIEGSEEDVVDEVAIEEVAGQEPEVTKTEE